MAKHTITVSDMEGGISIRVEGDGALESTAAGRVVKTLVEVAGRVVALQAGDCTCPKCQARREAEGKANPTESKPTLH
jgi:hypothetical protein